MSKKSYYDQLKDPRWQKLRLEVMQRENFTCEECDDATTTLNIHHTYYERGKAPWEYPADSLRCLCETCHQGLEADRAAISRELFGLKRSEQRRVLGYLRAMLTDWDCAEYDHVCNRVLQGMIDYWAVDEFDRQQLNAEIRERFEYGEMLTRNSLMRAVDEARKGLRALDAELATAGVSAAADFIPDTYDVEG